MGIPVHDFQDKIIYTLTCPHIFGDEEPHEIVTYWRPSSNGDDLEAVCYRVECDGKEFTDNISYGRSEASYVTIVLDRE
jgi:hypothetical protein